jgi:biotin transport system substrate-specific component
MSKPRPGAKSLALAGISTAITAVLAQISFPLPSGVPVTLQTLAVALCGYVLGFRLALASVAAYILLGAVGVPVFSSFMGGAGVLFGVTGGFIWGFLPFAALCGAGKRLGKISGILVGLAGLITCHIPGIIQFSIITGTPFARAVVLVSAPYFIKDAACVAAAYFLAAAINKRLNTAPQEAEREKDCARGLSASARSFFHQFL